MKIFLIFTSLLLCSLAIFPQKSTVNPTKNNILYAGISNPLEIVVENCSCDSIIITSTNGPIQGNLCQYYIKPIKPGNSLITIYKINGIDTILISTREFRVKLIPDPIANINGLKQGWLSKNILAALNGIGAEMDNFDYDVPFKVTEFNVIIERRGSVIYKNNIHGNRFPNEIKSQFYNLKTGDKVYFENIMAIGPDQISRHLNPLEFTIK